MKKNIAALALAIILSMTFAYADGFVSSPVLKSTNLVETVVMSENGPVDVVIVSVDKTEEDLKILEEIKEIVSEGKPVTEYFGEETIAAAVEEGLIPEGVKLEDYKLTEFEHIAPIDYDPANGEIDVLFTFATEYPEGATLLVLVGVMVDGEMQWIPQPAQAVGGKVQVHFTQDVLEAMQGKDIFLAILNAENV